MSESWTGKWGYDTGRDGIYRGDCLTPQQAAELAIEELGMEDGQFVEVGQYRDPTSPESYVDAEIILEHVACQDDYQGDFAEGWPGVRKPAIEELDAAITEVFAKWLDKHGARPWWFRVDEKTIRKFEMIDGQAVALV